MALKKINKKSLLILLILFLVLITAVFWAYNNLLNKSSNNSQKSVSGVQIITTKGSILVGNNKYTKSLDLWLNQNNIFFDSTTGKPVLLNITKNTTKKESLPAWSINKNTSKLTNKNNTLYTQQEKVSQALLESNIKKICAENISIENKSCHWNFQHDLNILNINNKFVCLQEHSLKELGGNKVLVKNKLINFDWQNNQQVSLKNLFKHKELKEEILNQLYENLKLELSSDSSSAASSSNIEAKLKTLLKNNSYKYSLDNLCVQIKTNAPYLVFGFAPVHNSDKNILISKILLTQDKLPKNIINLYKDFKFEQKENSLWRTMNSPDNNWSIAQNLDQIFIEHNNTNHKLTLNIPANYTNQDEILGIFWITKSPSLDKLEKNNYKKQEYKKEEPINLTDMFDSLAQAQE